MQIHTEITHLHFHILSYIESYGSSTLALIKNPAMYAPLSWAADQFFKTMKISIVANARCLDPKFEHRHTEILLSQRTER